MANSITLSQSLVDDIAQKITDGTATAEQVVLYTKGLNQLQTGNDFQSVVIGLSQSAVDAIDSANAQFQEDAQNALDTFSQTATNIDTSATNAVSAINIAKDTLVATDAELSTTIDSLPNDTAITKIVESSRRAVYNEEMPNWDGVHKLPRFFRGYGTTDSQGFKDIIHPWDTPAYLEFIEMDAKSGFWRLKNHKHEVMDEIPIHYDAAVLDTANSQVHNYGYKYVHRNDYELDRTHTYWFDQIATSPSSTSGRFSTGTSVFGPNGHSRYMNSGFAWRGMRPGFIRTTNETGGNEARTSSMYAAVIVGTSKKDFCINRPNSTHDMYLSSSMNPQYAQNSYMNRSEWEQGIDSAGTRTGELNQTDLYSWNGTNNMGGSSTRGDFLYHERFGMGSFISAGYGNMSYNMSTNKFMYIDINSAAPYARKPKLMTVASDFNLRDVALGKTSAGSDNFDPVANGKMVLEIDSNLDVRAEADAITSLARINEYDEHGGQVVLCDNDTIVNVWSYTTGTNKLRAVRAVKNGTNDEYVFDQKWDRTLQNYQQDVSYYGVTNVVTNDGRYAVLYTHDYYYGGGINGFIVRVSDGALLQFELHNSGSGMHLIPLKHDIIGFYRTRSNSWKYDISMDYLFSTYSDGDDVTTEVTGGTQYRETWFSYAGNHFDRRRSRTNTQFNIYNPYNYLMEYYNVDGTRKSQYDENLNLIP